MVGKLTPAVIHYPAEVIARAAELGIAPGFEVFVAAARRGVAETREWTYLRKNGSHFPVTLTVTAMRDSAGELTGFIGIAADISERKTNEEALKQSQQKLLETSRLAGKAEVATSVLHNVGNVLNSVNVSGNVLSERLRGSKVTILAKIADLLNEQRADFSGFVANDPRGKRIPDLIATLSEALREENHELLAEVSVITSHIGHIKEIVSMQQNYSKIGGVTENLEISDLLEDAMRMNAASLARHQIKVRQEYESVPKLQVDRHKVLQILVNLLNNAKQSVEESGREDKQVTLKIQNNGGQFIKISIQDNGVGIASNNLNRIFSHGFTTKKTGHGFGLHSGALAAVEAGGALRVQSDGLGKGATFTLELPVIPPSRTTQAKKQDASLLS
jgi:C4-dicarboxylate-specific signal transduction histidine kinase